jgi:hypothetical protein
MPFDRGYFNGAFLFNLFFMIYLFRTDNLIELELEQTHEEIATLSITSFGEDLTLNYALCKQDVFKLIGALHTIHKEMK